MSVATAAHAEELSTWTNADNGEVISYDSSIDPMEALADATGRPVVADPSGTSAQAGDPRAALASYALLVVFDSVGFSGASNGYYTTNSAICSGPTYTFNSLGTWNDRIDSFQSYNSCASTLYENPSLGGAQYGPFSSSSDIGAFRNRVSSIKVN